MKSGGNMRQIFENSKVVRVGGALAFGGLLLVPLTVSAATDSEETVINANLDSVITVTTNTPVNIGLTPTGVGVMSSANDTVTVSTNDTGGFTLTLEDSDADTNLVQGGDTIPASAGTQAAPVTLVNNTWGYRVDGIGGFGAGPTTQETNVATTTFDWAGVPANGAPNTIKTTATTATDDETDVWYGVAADTSNPSGTYTDTVTYTATTN